MANKDFKSRNLQVFKAMQNRRKEQENLLKVSIIDFKSKYAASFAALNLE